MKLHKDIKIEIEISDLMKWIREHVKIDEDLDVASINLQGEYLLLSLKSKSTHIKPISSYEPKNKRNRLSMKGWKVVGKGKYRGHEYNVYDVLVDAMDEMKYQSDFAK